MDFRRDEERKEDIQKAHNSFPVRETGFLTIFSNEKEKDV
jgi:hypothetical protein